MRKQTKNLITRSLLNINAAALLVGFSAVASAGQTGGTEWIYYDQHVNNTAWNHYLVPVTPGGMMKAVMSPNGTGAESDPDLYVQWGSQPTFNSYACRPATEYVDEVCDLNVPAGVTTAYVAVRGWGFNANYDLSVTFQAPHTDKLSGYVGNTQWVQHKPYNVTPGRILRVVMSPDGTGAESDPDLYVQFGNEPAYNDFACRPATEYVDEVCEMVVPAGQTKAYIGVRGWGFNANYSIDVSYL